MDREKVSGRSSDLEEKIRNLVQPDAGVIHASVYSDPEIYQLELERIFARSWIMLCPDSQIPNSGDYFVAYMGEDPVIVVRQADGSIAAFLNQCRHRGATLCRGESGNTRNFTCTYHGWTYDTAGTLTNVPREEFSYKEPLDRKKWSARRVPQVEVHHGLVFGNWDENAPDFRTSLGDAALYFDLNFGRTEGGMAAYGGVYKWRVQCNWKLGAEQLTSDNFHFMTSHSSAITALIEGEAPPFDGEPGRIFTSVEGHGGGFLAGQEAFVAQLMTTTGQIGADYITQIEQPGVAAKFGQQWADFYPVYCNFFPTFGYLHANRRINVWIPRGPNEMEIWAWVLYDRNSPEEVVELRSKVTAMTFGPAGIFEQDDSANWVDIQRPLSGAIARTSELNMQMGGYQSYDDWPGLTGPDLTEVSARNFYARWLELVTKPNEALEAGATKQEVLANVR